MTQYEDILSKISTVFYKFIRYSEYFYEFDDLIFQYLLYIKKTVNKKIPSIDALWLPDPNFPELGLHYLIKAYFSSRLLEEKAINSRLIMLTKASNIKKNDAILFFFIDQYVIILIINKFIFENQYPSFNFFGTTADCTYKHLFIGL